LGGGSLRRDKRTTYCYIQKIEVVAKKNREVVLIVATPKERKIGPPTHWLRKNTLRLASLQTEEEAQKR